jgi:hypothetical protein
MLSTILFLSQSALVTLDIPAERLEIAGPKIASALGYRLTKVAPRISNDVVMISVRDVSRSEFLSKFEETTHYSFFKEREGVSLGLTTEQEKAEDQAEAREIREKLESVLSKAKLKVSKMTAFQTIHAKQLIDKIDQEASAEAERSLYGFQRKFSVANRLYEETPGARFILRILASLSESDLESISATNPRIVFSSRPTRMQKPFSTPIEDFTEDFVHESEAFFPVLSASRLFGNGYFRVNNRYRKGEFDSSIIFNDGLASISYWIPESGIYMRSDIPRREIVAKDVDCVTLTANLNPYPNFALNVFDKEGRVVLSTVYPDGLQVKAEAEKFNYGIIKSPNALEKGGQSLEFSKNYLKATRQTGLGSISSSLKEKLMQPESVDLLSHCIPELIRVASGNRNVIALLDDSLLGCTSVNLNTDFPLSSLDPFRREGQATINDQWVLRSIRNPKFVRRTQIDRKKLGKLLQFVVSNQRTLTLNEEANFLVGLPWNQDGTSSYWQILNLINFPFPGLVYDFHSQTGLRILGLLTKSEREAALNGIDIATLSTNAQTEIFRTIFQDVTQKVSLESTQKSVLEFSDFGGYSRTQSDHYLLREKYPEWMSPKMSEPTFLLPTGLRRGMKLHVRETFFPVLLNGSPNVGLLSKMLGGINPRDYGRKIREKRNNSIEVSNSGPTLQPEAEIDETQILTGSKHLIEIGITLSDAPLMHKWFLIRDIVTDKTRYSIQTLPEVYRKELLKGLDN